jgi:Ca2+-transporting ATPase
VDKNILYRRIRIYISIIYRNSKEAERFEEYANSLYGVNYSKANPLTGSLLIIFDELITDETVIKTLIYNFIKKLQAPVKDKIINLNERFMNESANTISVLEPVTKTYINHQGDNSIYHAVGLKKITTDLNTDLRNGLNERYANERIKELGLNVISENKRKSIIAHFLENFNDFSTKLLTGVGFVSLLLGHIAEGAVILGIVALETILGTLKQYKAEKSLYSLKDMMVQSARVIRDSTEYIIDAKYLVPGDIIIVEAGEKIPADARIIGCSDLMTSEASLTGESTPICKRSGTLKADTGLGNRYNMLFMGTNVLSGRGKAIVVATGMNTQIGKIAYMLQNITAEPAPLETKIKNFTNKFTKASFAVCFAISAIGLLSGSTVIEVLMLGISFAIGAIPESLPAVVMAAMSSSVQKMAEKNVIVRKLPAVETLGAANVICCDKTGTLTMNEMTVRKIYTDNNIYSVAGTGYDPKGSIIIYEGDPSRSNGLDRLIAAGVLCNNSNLICCDGKWTVQGDPTEGALISAAHKHNLDINRLRSIYKRTKEIPFDSTRRTMTVIVSNDEETYIYSKGSISRIMEKCTFIFENGEERLFTKTDKVRLQGIADELGSEALRVLAFAYKKVEKNSRTIDNNFVFIGFVGMEDPPREGVKEAIQKCKCAGIKVVMITGDNKNTAAAIGHELGLLTDGLVVSGNELEQMSDDKLSSIINNIQIFARTSPEQKYRIVKAFKCKGNVVAMTGDGVNDAPAIKEANIGIAMGRNGSDVTKDAADIILVDDNFTTIVGAIEEGRSVYNNIRNSMTYLLSASLSEMFTIFMASAVSGVSPLLSMQVLWINVIAETLLGSTFALERPSDDIMKHPPISKDAPLFDRELNRQVIRRGFGMGISTFALFQGSLMFGASMEKARTLAFTNIIASQLVNVYDCRSNKKSRGNKYMNASAFISASMMACIIYMPFLNSFFEVVPLYPVELAVILGTANFARV